jgi:hypothetical protein
VLQRFESSPAHFCQSLTLSKNGPSISMDIMVVQDRVKEAKELLKDIINSKKDNP